MYIPLRAGIALALTIATTASAREKSWVIPTRPSIRILKFTNQTSKYMTGLEMAVENAQEWQEVFRQRVPPGTSFFLRADPDAPCRISFKAHFLEGRDMVDYGIDTCTVDHLDYIDFI